MTFRFYLFACTITLFAATSAVSSAAAQTQTSASLTSRLDAIFDDPKWENARWGVMIKDLDTSEVLYERDSNKSFMPASNMKLFTTAASLCTLGKDYRFETKIYATGTTDTEGTLHGNIYIVGSGDPSISGRYNEDLPTTAILAKWADAIANLGIKKIDGDIIGDDDIFDDSSLAGSWSADYLGDWYAAENSGLAINDNCWDLEITVDNKFPNGRSMENGKLVKPDNYVHLSDPFNTFYPKFDISDLKIVPDNDEPTTAPPHEEANLYIQRSADSTTVTLSGTIEEDSAPVHEWGSIHNGTLYTVTLLANELENRKNRSGAAWNISITGKPVDIDDMDKQVAAHLKANPGMLIHTHISPPLSRILAIVNKPSQNFYADMLLKVTGAKAHGLGSWNNGEKVVRDVLTTAGVSAKTLNMADGSGLSRRDQIEPRQAVALLTYMQSRPDFDVFEASLPIMGIDGTLKGRMKGTAAEGKVHAKTGTIGGVRALSGYMKAGNGHRLVFSMLANNYITPTSDATEAQNDAILELLKR